MEKWQDRISIDPAIMHGKPLITGTRVPVYIIVGVLASGMTVDEVCSEYDVTPKDVQAGPALRCGEIGRRARVCASSRMNLERQATKIA